MLIRFFLSATRGVSRRATGPRSRKKITPISDEESDDSDDQPDCDADGEQAGVEPAEPSRRNPTRKSVQRRQAVKESESEESDEEEEEEEEVGTASEAE
jgi:hypothetical protein